MTRTPTTSDLGDIVEATHPVLSSDASVMVYLLHRTPVDGPAVSELWTRPVTADPAEGQARQLTSGARDSFPALTPDGRTVAFVRTADGRADLYRLSLDDGVTQDGDTQDGDAKDGESTDAAAVRLTSGLRVTGGLAFAPDGESLAFVALVEDDDSDEHQPPAPITVDGEPQYKVDGAGWVGAARTQVFAVPTAGGDPVRLTGRGHCAAPAWSPDGAQIAFAHTAVDDNPSRLRQRVGLVDPSRPRESVAFPFEADGLSGPLTWTPDGSAVIAIGTEAITVAPAQLQQCEVATGSVTALTAALDRNVMGGGVGYPGGAPAFTADGRLVFCVRDGGQTVLYSRHPGGELTRHLVGDGTVVSALSVAGRRAAVRLSDPSTPGELALVDLDTDEVTRLTDTVAESLPDVVFLATEPREFRISDGVTVHGWLLRAPHTDGPAPTLLDIHGGPHNAWTGTADTAHIYHQMLADQGWNVLTLNPRASDGYGRDFLRGALGAWGEGDQQDLLEPLDQLIAEGLADPDRLAVTGYSYGGFMTCWLTAHTDRFRAAVPGGIVADHHTMSASSDMGSWIRDLEIGDREARTRLSPLTYADQVSTPSLVLHGQDDLRCPVGQAESWYARLRENGVPTRMVIYPGASHAFIMTGPVAHRQDYNDRLVDWVSAWTLGGAYSEGTAAISARV